MALDAIAAPATFLEVDASGAPVVFCAGGMPTMVSISFTWSPPKATIAIAGMPTEPAKLKKLPAIGGIRVGSSISSSSRPC